MKDREALAGMILGGLLASGKTSGEAAVREAFEYAGRVQEHVRMESYVNEACREKWLCPKGAG